MTGARRHKREYYIAFEDEHGRDCVWYYPTFNEAIRVMETIPQPCVMTKVITMNVDGVFSVQRHPIRRQIIDECGDFHIEIL